MIPEFLACRAHQQNGQVTHRLETMSIDDLTPGDVVIRVYYSSVNYKDALAATGRGRIMRRYPLNVGIDATGVVIQSNSADCKIGEEVLVNGCGLGETMDGGLAGVIRVPADCVVPLPQALTMYEAMALGTAGFTAALCVHRMQQNGQNPSQGSVVVTGASGGVGSIAVALLHRLGYSVDALSNRTQWHDYCRNLGATRAVTEEQLGLQDQALGAARFAGVIDSVGGTLLARLIAHVQAWGNVACVGLASDAALHTTVFPMILRGVSLLGISSTHCPIDLRRQLWQRLGSDWKPDLSKIATRIVALNEVSCIFNALLDRKLHGRIVVDCRAAAD